VCTVLSSFLYVDSLSAVAAKEAGMSRARVLACIVAPKKWLRPISIVMCTKSLAALDAELLWWA